MNNPLSSLIKYHSVQAALADEKELQHSIAKGETTAGSILWTTEQSLVVPVSLTRNRYFERAASVSASEGWPVFPRQTGGGVTPQGPGILNISLAFTKVADNRLSLADCYGVVCGPIIDELNCLGVDAYCASVKGAFCDGKYNVVVNGKKLAGTAQRWVGLRHQQKGHAVLAHALVLYKADLLSVIEAVKRFYSLLMQPCDIEASAHCNFDTVCPGHQKLPAVELMSRRLQRRCQERLQSISNQYDYCALGN